MDDSTSSHSLNVGRWANGEYSQQRDAVACEQAIALVYNGISHAVMMSTPSDLGDLAIGFSLSEAVVDKPSEIYSQTLEQHTNGIEIHIDISAQRFALLKEKRRRQVGISGCGLCGAESLDAAVRPIERSSDKPLESALIECSAIVKCLTLFEQQQKLRAETGAIHAAAWCTVAGDVLMVREDIGRHNAVDKVLGAAIRAKHNLNRGYLLLSSRISFEIVQKAATLGVNTIVAVSAPTSLAVSCADAAGICLVGRARADRIIVYTERVGVSFE